MRDIKCFQSAQRAYDNMLPPEYDEFSACDFCGNDECDIIGGNERLWDDIYDEETNRPSGDCGNRK